MSEPEIKPTTYNIVSEAMSVGSALHMPFDPISNPKDDWFFMDELDNAVRHASLHASAASRSAAQLEQEMQNYTEELRVYSWKGRSDISIGEVIDKLRTWIGRS